VLRGTFLAADALQGQTGEEIPMRSRGWQLRPWIRAFGPTAFVTAVISAGMPPSGAQPLQGLHSLPADASYRALPALPLEMIKAQDEAEKAALLRSQALLLGTRYDLADRPMPGVLMSGRRKAVQGGVRVRLAPGLTWEQLAKLPAAQIRRQGLLPPGFLPLPHVKQPVGGQVFPEAQIAQIAREEGRDLHRFDVAYDLPERFTPEFPAPLFLTTHPELGDVTHGALLTLRNYYRLMVGVLTPVQMEGLRLMLTPTPEEEFNPTDDRKAAEPSPGVACLDCHANFHTNAAFQQTPDVRPQSARFRLDTVSLRGLYNQQIHGSKRALRSVEDYTEMTQRVDYFSGDQVTAARKGAHVPDRPYEVAAMAQMQSIVDFPPAPKLDPLGRLDPASASPQELAGEQVFLGKGRCAECHAPVRSFMDMGMHDLKLERFYAPGAIASGLVILPDGPVKTPTLRGIKDSPPYLHDGRLLTLADSVEFFNLVLGLKLTQAEKDSLVAYLLTL
jgi:cytochrome c peroxidase